MLLNLSKFLLGILVVGSVLTITASCSKDNENTVDPSIELVEKGKEQLTQIGKKVTGFKASATSLTTSKTEILANLASSRKALANGKEVAEDKLEELKEEVIAEKGKIVKLKNDVEAQILAVDKEILKVIPLTSSGKEDATNLLKKFKEKRAELVKLKEQLEGGIAEIDKENALDVAQKALQESIEDLRIAQNNFNKAQIELSNKKTAKTQALSDTHPVYNKAALVLVKEQNAWGVAFSNFNAAQDTFNAAQTDLNDRKTAKTQAQSDLDAAQSTFDAAQTDLNNKKKSNTQAQSDLDAAQNTFDAALTNLNNKKKSNTQAQSDLNLAQSAFDTAQTDLNKKKEVKTQARENYNKAVARIKQLDNYLANVISDFNAAQNTFNDAEIELSKKKKAKTQAEADLKKLEQEVITA